MSLLLHTDVCTLTLTQSIFKTEASSQVFNHLWHPEATDVTEASALKAFNIRERWRPLTVLLVDAIVACHGPLCINTHIHTVHVSQTCLFFLYLKKAQGRLRKRTKPPCGARWVSIMCWEATGTNVDSVIPVDSDHVQIPSGFVIYKYYK